MRRIKIEYRLTVGGADRARGLAAELGGKALGIPQKAEIETWWPIIKAAHIAGE